MHLRLWSLLLVPLLLGAGQPIDPGTLAWDASGGPEIVAGYEVVQGWNGVEATSIVTGLSEPLAARTGTAYAARVRALPVDPVAIQPSEWATLTAEWPDVIPQIVSLSELGRTTAPLPGGAPVMAAAVRSYATTSNASRTNTTVTAPSGITTGDVLVGILNIGAASAPTVTPPSGWTEITSTGWPMSINAADPWQLRVRLYWKVASGESGNYTWSHSTAYTEAIIYCVSGGDNTTPVAPNPSSGSGTGTAPQTATAPTITTTTDGALVIFAMGAWDAAGPATPPTGTTPTFTEYYDPGSGGVFYTAAGVLATAGATGAKSIVNGNLTGSPWVAGLIAIAASTGATTPSLPPIYTNKFAHMLAR